MDDHHKRQSWTRRPPPETPPLLTILLAGPAWRLSRCEGVRERPGPDPSAHTHHTRILGAALWGGPAPLSSSGMPGGQLRGVSCDSRWGGGGNAPEARSGGRPGSCRHPPHRARSWTRIGAAGTISGASKQACDEWRPRAPLEPKYGHKHLRDCRKCVFAHSLAPGGLHVVPGRAEWAPEIKRNVLWCHQFSTWRPIRDFLYRSTIRNTPTPSNTNDEV